MKYLYLCLTLFIFCSCSKSSNNTNGGNTTPVVQTFAIKGAVFKGSFLRGSSLTFFELDKNLTQTGKSFNTNINDDYGNFTFNALTSNGTLMRVVGEGYFWNEVLNENSGSTINLNAICKLDSNETVNVNVLTNLEKPRVEYLYSKGMSFDSAKSQAVREVLSAFGITNSSIKRAEKVGVVGTGDDSKILLAISTLIQGYRTESEVLQLLSKFSDDLKTDGILSDTSVGNDIATHLYYIDTATVLKNFKSKYSNLYDPNVVNTMDMRFIKNFASNSNFKKSINLIDYPAKGTKYTNFPNMLNASNIVLTNNDNGSRSYTCVATLRKGMSLKIEITDANGNTIPTSFLAPNGPLIFNAYNDAIGWSINKVNGNIGNFPIATATALYNECFNRFMVNPAQNGTGTYVIKYYENGSNVPTQTKTITVQ
jgi:hypothetical protein